MFKSKRAAGRKAAAAILTASLALMTIGADLTAFAAGKNDAKGTETEAETQETDAEGTGVVTLSTDYPGVSIKPGDSATFSLYVTNTGSDEADLELSAEDLPDGWEGYFKGSQNEVSRVHVYADQAKDDSPALSYVLTVPEDTKEGDYKFNLKAADENGDNSSETQVNVKVSTKEEVKGSSEFTTKYSEQQGASGTKFSFDATVQNNGGENQTYSLSASAPDGWNVTFTPSGAATQVASLPVDAGSSQGMTIAVTPADSVTAGDYDVDVTAVSADETLDLPLKVTITGTYGLTLTTPTGNLSASAYAGEETKVTLQLQNTGDIDLSNIQLAGTGSTDWNVSFDQDSVDTLAAGQTANVTATIQPAKNSIIGDYVTQITAKNDQISSEADIRVSVKNHTTWGIVTVCVIAVLVVGLLLIIRKYGRR